MLVYFYIYLMRSCYEKLLFKENSCSQTKWFSDFSLSSAKSLQLFKALEPAEDLTAWTPDYTNSLIPPWKLFINHVAPRKDRDHPESSNNLNFSELAVSWFVCETWKKLEEVLCGKEGLFTLMRVQITGQIQEWTVILSGGVRCDFFPLNIQ